MARKPANFQWIGYSSEQIGLLDLLDHVGNNAWTRNGQTEALMPTLMSKLEDAGLSLSQVTDAMRSIGYSTDALHQLERWESQRTTGRFGR